MEGGPHLCILLGLQARWAAEMDMQCFCLLKLATGDMGMYGYV